MLLDTHKISLIYDFWKFNNEDHYLHDINEFSRKLVESDTSDGELSCSTLRGSDVDLCLAEFLRGWIPDLLRLVEFWEQQSFAELDDFYMKLLVNPSAGDQTDALLRFLYDIQSYEMVKYLLDKNVQHYKKEKIVSSTMTAFHEACIYGFSQVCVLYINQNQDVNEPFSLIYENCKTNEKETVRNLTALQLVCLWSKYFPKRLLSYAHTVRLLLNHGARVNMTSTELTTALHWTCRAQHTTPLAQDLIEFGAFLHARDRINLQPIHYACWSRNRTLVELLLQKGVRLTDQDDLGRTPIHFLCMPAYVDAICANDQQQQYEIMQSLLTQHRTNAYAMDLTQTDHQGHTLLAYACVSHNLPLIELLLQHQPDLLNTPTKCGLTPLMIAIGEGFLTGVEHLLQRTNLKRNVCDQLGNTALHHVCMYNNSATRASLLRMVLADQDGYFDLEKRNEMSHDALMLCVINQAVDACSQLIEKNVSVTKKDLHSRQPLHMACQMGNYELVALLLRSSEIQINAVDDCNRNCLFYAISSGNEKLLDLLIQNHVRIKIRDAVGDTPLHSAVQHRTNALELTRCLVKTSDGKDLINQPAADQMQPLLLAASCKQADVIYLLLKNGANVKAVDSEHHTALHLACKSGSMTSAFYLIEFGRLDVNALDCYRQTPIFYAYASNDFDLVQYLISCGARIDLRDSQNYFPLHIGILLCNPEQEFQIKLVDLYKNHPAAIVDDQNNECQMTPLILAAMQGQLKLVEHLVLKTKTNVMATCSNGHTALHYACLIKNTRSQEIIQFLLEHGCSYEKVDQPKGSFLYTITQHGDRQALMYFLDQWLVRLSESTDSRHCHSSSS